MATAKAISVNDADFENQVLKSDIPVLVDFWAPWCGPCSIAAPILDKIAAEYESKVKVCKVNVDEGRQTAMQYGVRSIPTLNFFKDGKRVDQIIGVTPNFESDIKRKLEPYI